MFGTNAIVGRNFFKNVKNDELLVTSRFFTLQGEGPFQGFPAYFIRLAKCNLACSFCDTYFEEGTWVSFSSLLDDADTVINQFFQKNNRELPAWAKEYPRKIVLVITGGEPSLQSNLSAFLHQAQSYFTHIQIESNGTTMLSDMPQSTLLVVSPKCLEKNGKPMRYLQPSLKILKRADCLKFVICSPKDSRYVAYSEIPEWAHEWALREGKPVFISPMNIYKKNPISSQINQTQNCQLNLAQRSNMNERVSFWEPGLLNKQINRRNHEYAAEYCMKYGFILSLQLHLFASLP